MSEMLHVRLKGTEKQLIEAVAKRSKRRVSDWVRLTLVSAIEEGMPLSDELRGLLEQVQGDIVR